MKRSIGWILVVTALLLQIMSWVSATSRSFAPGQVVHQPAPAPTLHSGSDAQQYPQSPQGATFQASSEDVEAFRDRTSKIGSSPPRCDGKCYGCSPCKPIQVPSITSRISPQYANYEPEGWQCKCGPSFYSP